MQVKQHDIVWAEFRHFINDLSVVIKNADYTKRCGCPIVLVENTLWPANPGQSYAKGYANALPVLWEY